MSAAIPTVEPTELRAGDTAKWQRSFADYSAADGWTLAYNFRGRAGKFDIAASASGSDHLVTVAPATTGGYAAGDYDWTARVSKAGEVYTVGAGRLRVLADLAQQDTGFDSRSVARRSLEAIDATLAGAASSDVASFRIQTAAGAREVARVPRGELVALRKHFAALVEAEDRVADRKLGRRSDRIVVRF